LLYVTLPGPFFPLRRVLGGSASVRAGRRGFYSTSVFSILSEFERQSSPDQPFAAALSYEPPQPTFIESLSFNFSANVMAPRHSMETGPDIFLYFMF